MYVSASPFPVAVRQRANESAQYAPLLSGMKPSFPETDQLIRGRFLIMTYYSFHFKCYFTHCRLLPARLLAGEALRGMGRGLQSHEASHQQLARCAGGAPGALGVPLLLHLLFEQ